MNNCGIHNVQTESIQEPSEDFYKKLYSSRVVIFNRPIWNGEIGALLHEAKQLGKTLIADSDDLYEPEMAQFNGSCMSGTAPYDEVKRWCELAVSSYPFFDSFLASTAVIANTLKRYGKPVYIMKNVIDDSYMLTHNISSNEDNPLSILIASGTKTHDHDLSTSYLDLLNFMLLHPDTTLSLLGDLDNDFSILGERCQKIPRLSYADMIGCLAPHDLLIVPLHKNPFNDGKSCIKFMEAASGLTPVLASSCKEFELAIKDGVTGFLYRDNFFEKLEEVYARRKEFPAIAASASAEVRKTHSTCSPATDAVEYLRSLVCKNVSPSTITMCLSICVLLSTLTCSMKFLPTVTIALSSCPISSQGKNISSLACFC